MEAHGRFALKCIGESLSIVCDVKLLSDELRYLKFKLAFPNFERLVCVESLLTRNVSFNKVIRARVSI